MKPSIRVIDWGWVFMAIVWALACLSGLAFIAYNSKDNPAHRCQCECPAPPVKPARIMT